MVLSHITKEITSLKFLVSQRDFVGFYPLFSHYVSFHPSRFPNPSIPKQKSSHHVNFICEGSPSRIRIVRRISFGMTTRPRSSILRTIPVAFISCFSFVIRYYKLDRVSIGSRLLSVKGKHLYHYFWSETVWPKCPPGLSEAFFLPSHRIVIAAQPDIRQRLPERPDRPASKHSRFCLIPRILLPTSA